MNRRSEVKCPRCKTKAILKDLPLVGELFECPTCKHMFSIIDTPTKMSRKSKIIVSSASVVIIFAIVFLLICMNKQKRMGGAGIFESDMVYWPFPTELSPHTTFRAGNFNMGVDSPWNMMAAMSWNWRGALPEVLPDTIEAGVPYLGPCKIKIMDKSGNCYEREVVDMPLMKLSGRPSVAILLRPEIFWITDQQGNAFDSRVNEAKTVKVEVADKYYFEWNRD